MDIPAKSRIIEDIVRRLRFKVSGKLLFFLLAQGHENISLEFDGRVISSFTLTLRDRGITPYIEDLAIVTFRCPIFFKVQKSKFAYRKI